MQLHQKYQTKVNRQIDFVVPASGGGTCAPTSVLMLVQAGDDRWFIVQGYGAEYSQCAGVLTSQRDLETEPTFYPTQADAAREAFSLIQARHPPALPRLRPLLPEATPS
jgi:hypothetical protein